MKYFSRSQKEESVKGTWEKKLSNSSKGLFLCPFRCQFLQKNETKKFTIIIIIIQEQNKLFGSKLNVEGIETELKDEESNPGPPALVTWALLPSELPWSTPR